MKTALSIGEIIYDLLSGSEAVSGKVTKVYPVISATANLPYVYFRRDATEQTPVKGLHGAEQVTMTVECLAADYTGSVELAEAVRETLDGVQAKSDDGQLVMRSCTLTGASETYESDAFVQSLTFQIKC